ncbi:hypothetical protein C0J52_03799 [Blattella germanica]|nr:hypothetical protein C0J52_03799 [Blattella germanica]
MNWSSSEIIAKFILDEELKSVVCRWAILLENRAICTKSIEIGLSRDLVYMFQNKLLNLATF